MGILLIMKDKNKTVVKSMDILKLFRNNGELTLNEIVKLSGMPKTSVHRMLGSLEDMEFLKRDSQGRYSLGLIFMEFGQLVKERINIRQIALPTMYYLREEVGEAVNLVIREGSEAIYIEKLDTLKPVRVYTRIGRRAPLYGGACPRILLAYMPKEELESYLNETELLPIGRGTILDKEKLKSILEQDRKNGYSISDSELQDDSFAVAAPIFDSLNDITASLSIVGPSVRFTEEHISKLIEGVKRGAREISIKLGWRP